jgi:hypothetical protein
MRAPSLAELFEQLQENAASARTLWQTIPPKPSLDVPRPCAGPPSNAWLTSISLTARSYRELRPRFPILGRAISAAPDPFARVGTLGC